MSVILTAPERIAIMCEDVGTIKKAFWTVPKDIDTAQRPACLIHVDEASFPPNGATDVEAEETYVIDYIGYKFDQGESAQYELEARADAYALYMYFFGRPGLQMTNDRGRQPAKLRPLAFVKWARIARRSPVALMTGNGITEPYWGCTYSLTVFSGRNIPEVLVPRT